jgi:hypothetical protein
MTTAFHNGLKSQNMFLLCACFNRCVEDVGREDNIFLGCRPVATGTLGNVESMFAAMQPGNGAIVQYNPSGGGMGHYVTLWQQRNALGELWYLYYNPIGNVKLFGGRSLANLAAKIDELSHRPPCIFNTEYSRVLFIFSLPEKLEERKRAVLNASKNMSDHGNRVMRGYLKLDQFSDIALPHNFFPAFLEEYQSIEQEEEVSMAI